MLSTLTWCLLIIFTSALFGGSKLKRLESFEASSFKVPRITVRFSDAKGTRGVFADADFKQGDVIEYAPVIEIKNASTSTLGTLSDYVFAHPTDSNKLVLTLGYLSLYNHDDDKNVEYVFDEDNNWYEVKAFREIRNGDELYVSYGSQWWADRPHINKK
jgi:hypothetical protein